jgi:hypothetical protein
MNTATVVHSVVAVHSVVVDICDAVAKFPARYGRSQDTQIPMISLLGNLLINFQGLWGSCWRI